MTHTHAMNQDVSTAGRGRSFLSGIVFGGLAGAAAALLLAPRPGADTRRMIRGQVETAREQTRTAIEDARATAEKAVHDASVQVEQAAERGRGLVKRNVNRLQETAAAVKATAQEAWQGDRAEAQTARPAQKPQAAL